MTATDKEALIHENNLIKHYKPRYNIRLKDDKSYLSIKVTTAHPWPRILATRKIVKDGSRYFGPFSSAVAARETIDIIEKHFLLRNCTDHNFRNRSRPCLQYQIKRCMAPCVLPVSAEMYREQVRQAMLFIDGKRQELLGELKQRMQEKSDALEFEAAARIRAACAREGQDVPEERPALMRAIFESLACKYRVVLEQIEEVTGRTIDTVHVLGGGSQNTFLCQLTANVTRRVVFAGPVEAAALGNVLVQMHAFGDVGSLAEMRELVRRSADIRVLDPDPAADMWNALYGRFRRVLDSEVLTR